MSIIVGENSWVTIAEADDYFATRIGTTSWFSLSDTPSTPGADSKESFLVTAFYWLVDDVYGLTPSSSSAVIKRVQLESALFLLKYSLDFYDRQAKVAGGVTSFMLSRWTENLSSISKPQNILDILYNAGYSSSNTFVQLEGEDYE